MVVDRNVDVFPASTTVFAVLTSPCYTMSRVFESPEFLDIQVQEVTGCLMLVTVIGSGRFKMGQPIQPGTHQDTSYRAVTEAECQRDLAVGLALLPKLDDAPGDLARCCMRTLTPTA